MLLSGAALQAVLNNLAGVNLSAQVGDELLERARA
jgi:hypothetical protein